MSETTQSKESNAQAKSWLTPDQIQPLREAAYDERFAPYLTQRNEVIILLLYDTGIRVSELVQLDVDYLNLDQEPTELYLPSDIQKGDPPSAHLDLTPDLLPDTLLRAYLNNRWKDTNALFPSREATRITANSVRRMVQNVAKAAEVKPHLVDGGRGHPSDVTPHTFRHSVAFRMLREEEARLIDVRDRLRHASIQTTEQVYEHFKRR